MDPNMTVEALLRELCTKRGVTKTKRNAKRTERKAPRRTVVKLNDPNYRVYQNIEGMCIPLHFSLDIDNSFSMIRGENLFPYKNVHSGDMGFFLLTIDGKYATVPQNKLRAILHGKIEQFRPRDNIPPDNRIKTLDGGCPVEICYWPDSYWRRDCSNRKKIKA